MNTIFIFIAIGVASIIAIIYFFFTYRHQIVYYDDEIPRIQLNVV